MKKLKQILLIDDNEFTNFLHKKILMNLGCAEEIKVFQDAELALDYISGNGEIDNDNCVKPDLIFLDINMPGMDGWEFIEEYNKLDKTQKTASIFVLLSSTIAENEKKRAENITAVKGFHYKPLTEEMIFEIMNNHLN